MKMKLEWESYKGLIKNNNCYYKTEQHYVSTCQCKNYDRYFLRMNIYNVEMTCLIVKNGSNDQIDFENNYVPLSNVIGVS